MKNEMDCRHEHTGWDIRPGYRWAYTCKGCGATGHGESAKEAHESWMEMRSNRLPKGQAA